MSKTLLLADDSVTIQRVIELTFAHEDVRVVPVGDGRRALEWLESTTPDIVLVDVEVPEVDGYAVTAHVKTSPRLKHVPVLLLAGAFEPVDQDRAKSAGCDGVIVKPFEPQQLVTRVKELLSSTSALPGAGRLDGPREGPRRTMESEVATVTPFPTPVPARSPEVTDGAGSPFRAARAAAEIAGFVPEPLEPPTRPVWEAALGGGQVSTPLPKAPDPIAAELPPAKISLVNAFTALLAAEQSSQPVVAAPVAAAVSDASVEDAVRRVLTRMTDDLVRRIVLETAERLIKEEIEKIKATPE